MIVTDAPQLAASDLVLARNMAETLHRHYPGHAWAVTCERGVATVRDLLLSGQMGFVLRVADQYSASEFERAVVRAGGEMLERYRLSRGQPRDDEYENLPADFAGRLAFDGG